jgi:hypothetical protein
MREHQHVREWDNVIVTGRCFSCPVDTGCHVEKMTGVVGAVCRNEDGDVSVKVWPDESTSDPDGCGKMWFWFDEAQFVVTQRCDDDSEIVEGV